MQLFTMSQYNDHQDGNRANRDQPRSFQDISLSYNERRIASIVNHTVSETLRSISRPTRVTSGLVTLPLIHQLLQVILRV